MKSKSSILPSLAALAASFSLFAGELSKPYVGSAEFEKMKTLAGTWQGTTDMGKGPMPITVKYRVTSGGSAVEERLFADTPMEMVTIYHDRDGRLALTHYCTLCNRPAMTLMKADNKSFAFTLTKDSGIDVEKEKHMHSAKLTFEDVNHLTHEWTAYDGGKPQPSHPFKLERVKP